MEIADHMLISSDDESDKEEQEAKNSFEFPENNNSNTEQDWDDIRELTPKAYAHLQNKMKNKKRKMNYFSLWDYVKDDEEEAMQVAIQFSLSTYDQENKVKDDNGKGVVKDGITPIPSDRSEIRLLHGSTSFIPVAMCGICCEALPAYYIIAPICRHTFCHDCIKEYVGQKANEDIFQVECPVIECKDQCLKKGSKCITECLKKSIKCKTIFDKNFILEHAPDEVYQRWRLAMIEASVLQRTMMYICPLEGCGMSNVYDGRRFPIRACTWCWRLFCWDCASPWHMGMTCIEYYRVKLEKEKERREKAALAIKLEKEKQAIKEKATKDFVQRFMDQLRNFEEAQAQEIEKQKTAGSRKRKLTTSDHEEGNEDQGDDGMPVLLVLGRPPHSRPVETKKTPLHVVGLDGVTKIVYFEF